MPKFTYDETASKNYFDDLNRYMQDNVLSSDGEILDDNFKALDIQLPHVGDFYDLKRDGKPFRVLIFGQDPKDSRTWDMQCKKKVTQKFNNIEHPVGVKSHMTGTLYTLQLLFDMGLGENNLEITTEKGKIGIFSAFALFNACLCKQGDVVRENSLPHFKKTIEILQPRIIILQGEEAATSFNEAFHSDQTDNNISQEEVSVHKINNEKVLVLWLYHHSHLSKAHWSSDKIKDYYGSNISKLLEKYEDNSPV